MTDPFDIGERLDTHIRVAQTSDGEISKGEPYYRYRLSQLSDEQRAEIVAHCEANGCRATFVPGELSGMTLVLRKKC